ncbi:MAG: helix-turn-helix domain-containing protein [Sphingobacteriaceae bacterium]|jgi:hypothetical protein
MSSLSEAALLASKFINQTNRHVFLTGKAGTGKTTFLKYIIQHTHKKAAIVAPTGIAAINAGGTTIHSMFQLPFGSFVPVQSYQQKGGSFIQLNDRQSLFKNHQMNKTKRAIIRELELLIIDEVSMLRADLLDAIDAMMRSVRGRTYLPFGGVQVLFIGDMYQLPPVVKDEEWQVLSEFYKSIYFFDSIVLQNDPPIYIELDKIYRQNDQQFISVLNNLRDNKVTRTDVELLNRYYKPQFKQQVNDNYITLTTHNHKANKINKDFLAELKGDSFYYQAEIKDDYPENLFPLEQTLELKKGSQVMFIKNDISGNQNYFNGKLAKVVDLSNKEIFVEFEDGQKIKLEKYKWENKRYIVNDLTNEIEEEVIGEFVHYPVKLAWAITVHKSQGLTFDKAIIDVADAFAPGQVYVALSRLRDLNGLILTSPINFNSISSDQHVTDFSNTKNEGAELEVQLNNDTIKFLRYYLNFCYDFTWLNNSLNRHYKEHFEEHKSKLRVKFNEWMQDLVSKVGELKTHADKFANQLNGIIDRAEPEWKINLVKRVKDAQGYFTPILKNASNSILVHIEILKEEKKTKQYTAELAKLEVLFFEQVKKIDKSVGLCEAIIKGETYTKENYNKLLHDKARETKILENAKTTARNKKEKGIATEKIDTKQLTYDLYKLGNSMEQIAEGRKLSLTTVEGHMAYFVATGQLSALDFVSQKKIDEVQKAMERAGSSSLKKIKEELDPSFSYADIKFAMAALEN